MSKKDTEEGGLKVIVIAGPTAVGKSSLAVSLAIKFGGEIVSADSRQVYKKLDIGTEKITENEMHGIPHHLIDVVSPRRAWSVAGYKKAAEKAISGILRRENLPFLVGGTGFYIDAVVYGHTFPSVPPNALLRKKLEKQSAEKLLEELARLDARRAGDIETKNKRRIIRAIEIARALGNVPDRPPSNMKYNALIIGLSLPEDKMVERINTRLTQALKRRLVNETKGLIKSGMSWKRINELGLEYRIVGEYIRNEISRTEMVEKLKREVRKYAKRQMRWFKRNKQIEWYSPNQKKLIEKRIAQFLKCKD